MATRVPIPWQAARPGRYALTEWTIDPSATALVLMHLQDGHVDADRGPGPGLTESFPDLASYYYRRLFEGVLARTLELEHFFHAHEMPIAYICSAATLPHGGDVAPWSWRARRFAARDAIPLLLPPDEPDGQLWSDLAPARRDLVLHLPTLSPFNSSAFDQLLRNMGVENLVLAGVLTNAAVETTARGAGDRGFNVLVAEDACAALSEADHADGTQFASWYVARSTADIIATLQPHLTTSAQ